MAIVLAIGAGAIPALAQSSQPRLQKLAPYVSSPQRIVEKMLDAAVLKPGEVLDDLGCGDGRVLITAVQRFGARAVGIEISDKLVKIAKDNIKRFGFENRATVIHGDLLDADVSPADVVVLYLLTDSNEMVRPKLERSLRPGARVVSHDFQVRGWKPSAVEKSDAFNRTHTIYVYRMPQRKDGEKAQ